MGSKFESNSNPSFSYNLTVFYDFVMNRDVLSLANMRHNPLKVTKCKQNNLVSIILVSKSIIRFILFDFCNIFGVENREKLHKNEYFRGKFYENCTKMTILEADLWKI